MTKTPIMVTMRHARAARLDGKRITCAPGIRAWAARHGIDLHTAGHAGIPVEDVERIGDAFALRAAALARAEGEQADA